MEYNDDNIKIGPYSTQQLKKMLTNVSLEEMKHYHKNRIKTYRYYTRFAYILGILCIVFYFINLLLTLIMGISGFIIISLTKFKKMQWLNLYENFMYYKKTGDADKRYQQKINAQKSKKKHYKHRKDIQN